MQKATISIKFSPRLNDADIREEAVRLVTKTMEAKARQEFEEAQLAAKRSQEGANEEEDNKVSLGRGEVGGSGV